MDSSTYEYCSTSDYTSPSSAEADSVLSYCQQQELAEALPKCSRAMWKRGRMNMPEQLEQGGGQWKKTRVAHSRSPISAAVMHMHSLGSVWVHNLKVLNSKCCIGSAAPIDRSLGLLLRYLGAADLCLARTDQLAAALWIAIKFDTPRACVPSRTLMAQATAVPAELLSATEVDILVGLRFDVLNGSMVARE